MYSRAAMDPTQLPASPPPPGIRSNFDNPDNYKSQVIILQAVVVPFTTLAVFIRLYTRAVIKKSLGADDWLALLSLALVLLFSVVTAYSTVWGFGMHIYDIRATEILHTLKWLAVTQKTYFPLILAIKLCILLGYLRIFSVDRFTKWGIWAGIVVVSIFYVVFFFLDIFRCMPVEAAWNPTIKGRCLSYAALPDATGIVNLISDFYILLLPLRPIFNMNMDLSRRLRIASIFGLGLTCIASILRFVVSIQYAANPDQTYVAAKVLYWTVLEINIGLICPCVIVSPAFFDIATPKSFGSLVGSLLAKRSGSQSNIASPPGSNKGDKGSYHSREERESI
ncbi:hypothetical protein F4802DRAFT_212963 [Xylaria palmicola]|nr:hypothetical protein F4802DRAFT_212963 [Xylaria palmicola]